MDASRGLQSGRIRITYFMTKKHECKIVIINSTIYVEIIMIVIVMIVITILTMIVIVIVIMINYIRIVRNVKNPEKGPRLATCHQYAACSCMMSGITSLKPSEMDMV